MLKWLFKAQKQQLDDRLCQIIGMKMKNESIQTALHQPSYRVHVSSTLSDLRNH
jgi:hypothetical protein